MLFQLHQSIRLLQLSIFHLDIMLIVPNNQIELPNHLILFPQQLLTLPLLPHQPINPLLQILYHMLIVLDLNFQLGDILMTLFQLLLHVRIVLE